MNYTKIILIRFENYLPAHEIEAFRGAVISQLKSKDLLFHNHLPDSEAFATPIPSSNTRRVSSTGIRIKTVHTLRLPISL